MGDDKKLTFPKDERICWKRHLDLLFTDGLSFVTYPFRVIYLPIKKEKPKTMVSIVISVPKKRLRHAVDRNFVKRRIRESYRLRKHELIDLFDQKDTSLLIAFLYLSKDKSSFGTIDKAMTKAVHSLIQKCE